MSDTRTQAPTTRIPGGGQAGRNAWRRYAVWSEAGTMPVDRPLGVNAERQEDLIWLVRVEDSAGDRVDGRTYTVGFGRLAAVEGAQRDLVGSIDAADELVSADPTARPDVVYQQPALGDRLVAWLDDAGTVDLGGGERVVAYFKGWARLS